MAELTGRVRAVERGKAEGPSCGSPKEPREPQDSSATTGGRHHTRDCDAAPLPAERSLNEASSGAAETCAPAPLKKNFVRWVIGPIRASL